MGFVTGQQTYNKVFKLISSSRFQESLMLLKNRMHNYSSLTKEYDKVKAVESTYRYMLEYIAEGHKDPSQKEMIEQIRDTLLHANDILYREEKLVDSSDQYSSIRRMFSLQNITFKALLDTFVKFYEKDKTVTSEEELSEIISPDQANAIIELFNYVWTIFGAEEDEYNEISQTLDNPDIPAYLKSSIISALVLDCITYFDKEAFEILLNQYESSEDPQIKARAITGIVLISIIHSKRIAGNLEIRSRLILANKDEDMKRLIREVLVNILRTYDTKRIDNKMRNEVIPGLMKINPDIIDKMRNLSSESENFLSDENPEWEELIENSEIGDKIKEINDMQLDGADVMVTAFSNLKNFPFFYHVSNWFLPFTSGHFLFNNMPLTKDKDTEESFKMVMCDSDLNSFFLSLTNFPEERKEQMFKNMQHQLKEAKEAMSNSIGETDSTLLIRKIRHNLQDLYRFFKFYRKKNEFKDPFDSPFLINHIEPLIKIFDLDREQLMVMEEFYFKHQYYSEALGFLETVEPQESGNFNIWEKIGYCYDRLQNPSEAAKWYKKAELINPGSAWLEKKLAVALKNSGQLNEALEYYKRALDREPENYHLLMSAAQCNFDLGNITEALKLFYHAQYLKPDKIDPLRALAWTELHAGNFEKANSLYIKILDHPKADNTDVLNAAHNALASGDFKIAIQLYRQFVDNAENKDITTLLLAFKDDAESLKKLGIKTSDLRLIVDKIRYDLINPMD